MSDKEKVVGYCRTSTSDQEIGIDKQESRIREYCQESGYYLVEDGIYSNQISGRAEILAEQHTYDDFAEVHLRNRPVLRQAFYDIINSEGVAETGSPPIEKLIVLNPSRLARRSHYQGLLEDIAELYGFEIEYVEASEKWILRKIQSIWDEYEVRQTIKRTKEALEEKPDDEWKGRPPTGHEVDEDSGKLVRAEYWDELHQALIDYQANSKGYRKTAEDYGEEVTASRIRTLHNMSDEEKREIRRCLKEGEK